MSRTTLKPAIVLPRRPALRHPIEATVFGTLVGVETLVTSNPRRFGVARRQAAAFSVHGDLSLPGRVFGQRLDPNGQPGPAVLLAPGATTDLLACDDGVPARRGSMLRHR